MITRRLIAPLVVAFVTLHAGQAGAQGAFPAPLPNEPTELPPVNASPLPRSGIAPLFGRGFGAPPPASGPTEVCMKEFVPLREEAEKRGKLIIAARDRKAPPDEACKLIASFGHAEITMIKYVEANAAKCAIPPQIADQLKAGHKNTEALQQKVCAVAQQMQEQSPFGPARINDIGDPAMEKLIAPLPKPRSAFINVSKPGPLLAESTGFQANTCGLVPRCCLIPRVVKTRQGS